MGTLISLGALALLIILVTGLVGSPIPRVSEDLAALRRKDDR